MQPHLSAIVQRRFSLFGQKERMPNETDAKKILTASPLRTGGDHQAGLELSGGWGVDPPPSSCLQTLILSENRL